MHREVEELMGEFCDLKEIKKTLTSWLKEEVHGGKECFDAKTCGAVMDMVKDAAETMKECYEALYYKTVIEAMGDGREPAYGGEEVYGYNHRHTANGQFARSGRGHMVSGYNRGPYMNQEPYIDAYLHDPNFEDRMKHGSAGMTSSKDGEIYDNYRMARRHYHDSKSEMDKEEMNEHCMKYMDHTLKHLKSMWEEADPMLKKRLKEDFGEEMAEVLEKL